MTCTLADGWKYSVDVNKCSVNVTAFLYRLLYRLLVQYFKGVEGGREESERERASRLVDPKCRPPVAEQRGRFCAMGWFGGERRGEERRGERTW